MPHSSDIPGSSFDDSLVFTMEETAKVLKVSRTLVYDLVREGRPGGAVLKSLKVGGRRLVPRWALEEFLRRQQDEAPAPQAAAQ